MSPDDESFGLGALLDGFVQAGAAVSMLCLTQGEASTLGVSEGLGRVRAEELRQAAEEVGIGSAVLRDYRDAHLGEVASHMLVDEVLHELDARPAVGVTGIPPYRGRDLPGDGSGGSANSVGRRPSALMRMASSHRWRTTGSTPRRAAFDHTGGRGDGSEAGAAAITMIRLVVEVAAIAGTILLVLGMLVWWLFLS